MRKLLVDAVDEEGNPTGKKEEAILCDAICHLVDVGIIDSDEGGLFFQRQLEYIQAQSYDVLYPDMKGRSTFSLNTEGGEGINQITYRSYDKRGDAVVVAGKATDLPRGDISGKEYTIDVQTIGNAYGYSRQELAAAKLTGMPLDARKAEATRRGYEEKINKIIWFGESEYKLNGLFGGSAGYPWSTIGNDPVAAPGTGSAIAWDGGDKTTDEAIADITGALARMYDSTKMIHRPNKILMSVAKYQWLINTPRNELNDTSCMKWLISNNEFITSMDQIVPINELKGVFGVTPGETTGDKEGFVVLEDSPDNLRIREPFPYIHLPVQLKGLEFEINCYGRFAGLEIIRPAAISFHHGI